MKENPELFATFMKNEAELALIDNFLTSFEATLDTLSNSITKYDSKLKSTIIQLNRSFERLQEIGNVDDIRQVNIPCLNW